jgi:hypothetical protein
VPTKKIKKQDESSDDDDLLGEMENAIGHDDEDSDEVKENFGNF